MDIAALIPFVLRTSIVLSVFAMGLNATLSDATFLFRRPRYLGRALLSMYVLMPLVAFVVARTLRLEPAVTIALVTLSLSPIPPILPKKALKTGGREDYSLGLLVATALVAIVLVPVALEIIESFLGVALQMSAMEVFVTVFTTVLAPLLIGVAVRAFAPLIAEQVAKPLAIMASALLILSVLPVFVVMARTISSLIGNGTAVGLAVFAVIGYISGHLLGGPERENRPVLALATATRHPAVAIGIVHANFPEQRLAVAAVFLYLIVSGILSLGYLKWPKCTQAGPTAPTSVPKLDAR